jgi:glycosyltransferase involved in cell wall biosynthesis
MRILTCLYYYRPHYSGLTVYTERLARTLAARGHHVTVLTSRYNRSLPRAEHIDGVEVRRVRVAFTLSKGPVMPSFLLRGWALARQHDVVHLHVPQLDAAPMALLSKVLGRPTVLTYHCDLRLPSSPLNLLANLASDTANRLSLSLADLVVTNTRDYAESSPLLGRYLSKMEFIPPPIESPRPLPEAVAALRQRAGIEDGQVVIGMAARLATEKGAEVLARAMPAVLQRYPTARVLHVGQTEAVMGEEAYARRLEPLLTALGPRWMALGVLTAEDMAAFYSHCHVTVLPSLNSTESFGMVQVESMTHGVPVVASDLPGVRQPTAMTGMGLTFRPGDPKALADAICRILAEPEKFRRDSQAISATFSSSAVAERYEALFVRLLEGRSPHVRQT